MQTLVATGSSGTTSLPARRLRSGRSRRQTALGLAFSLLLSGCATIPAGLPVAPVRVSEIVAALHCELAGIYADNPDQEGLFYGWAAGAELNLITNRTSAGTPGLTVRQTISAGKLTAPGSATFSDTARQDYKFRDFISLGALNPQTATGAEVLAGCPKLSPESQGMGVGATLADLARADANDGASHIQIDDKTNMVVDFTATRSLDGGLTLETSEFTASLNAGKISRTVQNKITITFIRDPNPPPLITSDNEMFSAASGGGDAGPSPEAIRALNDALDELTDEKCIKITTGDTVIEQCSN
jgi:hypothetical protein